MAFDRPGREEVHLDNYEHTARGPLLAGGQPTKKKLMNQSVITPVMMFTAVAKPLVTKTRL